MTEPKKPSRARKPPAKTGATQTRGKSAAGQKVTDAKTTGRRGFSDEIKATARALWEGDINATFKSVAEEVGATARALTRWSQAESWTKRKGDMSERAHAAADTYTGKLAELGSEITIEQQKQAEEAAIEETAIQLRAALINKHRKEWDAVRALLYKGMGQAKNSSGFDASKFAKISAETLKIIQESERRSWGIDSGPDTKVQVVIERE